MGIFGKSLKILLNLVHQFPSGGKNQGPGIFFFPLDGCADKPINQGDYKGGTFACAGLGLGRGISTVKGVGKKPGLDICAVMKIKVTDGMHQSSGKLKIMEAGLPLLGFDLEILYGPARFLGFWTGLFNRLCFPVRGFCSRFRRPGFRNGDTDILFLGLSGKKCFYEAE